MRRLNLMRLGYGFVGVGLAVVKWPLLFQDIGSVPVLDGVVVCVLTAMSLLMFLGLRNPVALLPILLFEVLWKAIWLAVVAVPHLVAGDTDAATGAILISCSLIVVVIAVVPWRFVRRRYLREPGEPWRLAPPSLHHSQR
ncbi:hypothetical protein GCM10023175_11420 [Pseudonocardia xishanensis]|uniref:Integral membrane protein n=1 Tax=Pseudonocardia xishanensis TaxID=630995 RepID=A0ABP8RJJ3_9PSEU